jgi:SAM-dependent methyltransferase
VNHERARSFGSIAENYDRYRPGTPPGLADVLGPLEGLDTLEVAAGTGLVTRFLVAHGARVSALEPDDAMRAVLAARSPGVFAVAGVAEEIPFPDAAFDLVVVSSAWHWFVQPAATDEIARVLRDAGHVVVLGNGFDRRHDWLEDLAALRETGDQSFGARRAHDAHEDLARGPFDDLADVEVDWTWRRTPEELAQLFATYSGVITRPPEERLELLGRVRTALTALASDGVIVAPMVLRGVVARRRPR